jgi:hypothetical protein
MAGPGGLLQVPLPAPVASCWIRAGRRAAWPARAAGWRAGLGGAAGGVAAQRAPASLSNLRPPEDDLGCRRIGRQPRLLPLSPAAPAVPGCSRCPRLLRPAWPARGTGSGTARTAAQPGAPPARSMIAKTFTPFSGVKVFAIMVGGRWRRAAARGGRWRRAAGGGAGHPPPDGPGRTGRPREDGRTGRPRPGPCCPGHRRGPVTIAW